MLMLPNPKISKMVTETLCKNMSKGSIIIDSSTISPLDAQEIHKEAMKHGILYLDAPVSGGVTGAQAATLTFMVGS